MPRGRKIVWWSFVAVVVAASMTVSAVESDIAKWLDVRIGVAGILVGCGLVFALIIWIASKLE